MAIAFVLMSHICDKTHGIFLGLGQFGVWLFFVLSAFLLSLYFYERPDRLSSPLEWANYALRRVLRIYPLFALAMIVGVFCGSWHWGAVLPVLELKAPAFWAIFVEFRAYFFLPAIIVLFELGGRVDRTIPPIILMLCIVAHYAIFKTTYPGYEPWGHETVVAYEYLIVFAIGSFAAWLYVSTRERLARFAKSRAADLTLTAMFLLPWLMSGQTLSFLTRLDIGPVWYHFRWLIWGLYFAACLIGIMVVNGRTQNFFAHPVSRWMGFASFSLYLFSDYILHAIQTFTGSSFYALFIASIVPLAVMSYVSFRLIERPLSRVSLFAIRKAVQRRMGILSTQEGARGAK